MSGESFSHNRLLLEIDKTIKELNRQLINPLVPELKIADLTPIMALTAKARGLYLKELLKVASDVGGEMPSGEQIGKLKQLRENYEELVTASQALETAIERGYLDVGR